MHMITIIDSEGKEHVCRNDKHMVYSMIAGYASPEYLKSEYCVLRQITVTDEDIAFFKGALTIETDAEKRDKLIRLISILEDSIVIYRI